MISDVSFLCEARNLAELSVVCYTWFLVFLDSAKNRCLPLIEASNNVIVYCNLNILLSRDIISR
jgi:hypothetical protein